MMNLPYRSLKIEQVPLGNLVIFDWDDLSDSTNPRVFENVQLFGLNDQIIWTVNGMHEHNKWNPKLDVFVGLRRHGGVLQLISFSGNAYDLNLETGRVKYATFVK